MAFLHKLTNTVAVDGVLVSFDQLAFCALLYPEKMLHFTRTWRKLQLQTLSCPAAGEFPQEEPVRELKKSQQTFLLL